MKKARTISMRKQQRNNNTMCILCSYYITLDRSTSRTLYLVQYFFFLELYLANLIRIFFATIRVVNTQSSLLLSMILLITTQHTHKHSFRVVTSLFYALGVLIDADTRTLYLFYYSGLLIAIDNVMTTKFNETANCNLREDIQE